jgi:hypothetical protein
MKKTAVLFISHIVTDETLSRYKSLQDGCNDMGYDLFWAMDADSKHRCLLPEDIKQFVFSFDEYRETFPKMPHLPDILLEIWLNQWKSKHIISFDSHNDRRNRSHA